MSRVSVICLFVSLLLPLHAAEKVALGVLQLEDAHAERVHRAGVEYATLEIIWSRLEPRQDVLDEAYVAQVRQRMEARRKTGFKLCLDLGVQYPPEWVLALPDATYVNQYGDAHVVRQPGALMVNAVFSRAVRERVEKHAAHVRELFGEEFALIRLGWGHYGELNYPGHRYNGRENCYWAFDRSAQGQTAGGVVAPCPVPGYIPGSLSPNDEAQKFLAWYLDALQNYHDWQFATMRKLYPLVPLGMLYPSWGLRPGQIEKALAVNLDGSTSAERNGELQRGFDFARFIAGITDANAVVYCTWIDSSETFGNDASPDPAQWGPAHYLAHLAETHPLRLNVWGENTGGGGLPALKLTAERARRFGFKVVLWAFAPQLFSGEEPTLEQLTAEFLQASEP